MPRPTAHVPSAAYLGKSSRRAGSASFAHAALISAAIPLRPNIWHACSQVERKALERRICTAYVRAGFLTIHSRGTRPCPILNRSFGAARPLNSGVRRNHFSSFRQHLYSPQSDPLNRRRNLICTPWFIAAAHSARTVRCLPRQVGSPGQQRQLRSRRSNLCRNSASTKHLACLQPGRAQGAGASHFCSVRSRGLSNYSFKGNQNRTDSGPLNSGVRRNHFASFRQDQYSPRSDPLNLQRKLRLHALAHCRGRQRTCRPLLTWASRVAGPAAPASLTPP
jgi:hypothetical protein